MPPVTPPTAPLTPAYISPLFPSQTDALIELRADLSLGAAKYLSSQAIADDALLWNKLLSAQAQAERRLDCFFSSVEVIPDDATQEEIDALESAGTRYVQESGYDFMGDMFFPDKFGFLALGHKPVQVVHSVIIRTPMPFFNEFQVPADWIRLTKKYGTLQFVPVNSAITTLGQFGVGFLSGSDFPNAIAIRYTAGLVNANGTLPSSSAIIWPDLRQLVKKMAILSMLQTSFMPSSSSISGDGLSQSKSFDMEKMEGVVEALIYGPKGSNSGLYTAIHGVRMGVLG